MASESPPKCPLCDRADVKIGGVPNRDAYACYCPACGRFIFTWEAANALASEKTKPRRYLLSAHTRRASDRGERLELLTYSVADLLEKTVPPRTPYDVLDPLLVAIHDRTTDPTGYVEIPYDDYPLFFLRGPKQLSEFLTLLKGLKLIEVEDKPDKQSLVTRLTLAGWDRVAELRKTGKISSRAFVAMSFAEELDPAYDQAIAPALTQAGWTPIRMDRIEHNERIDDRIVAEIKRAGMVVADFTGNRPGVYFEAGLAAGLGLPVIWTVRDTDLDAVHFDTRQYNHIVWNELPDFRARLHDRVVATVRPPTSDAA